MCRLWLATFSHNFLCLLCSFEAPSFSLISQREIRRVLDYLHNAGIPRPVVVFSPVR
jgi:hypothetical protein